MTAQPHTTNKPTRPEKTPAGIRAAIIPEEVEAFEADYRAALKEAGETFDLTPVHKCMEGWWRTAVMAFNDHDGYRDMLETVRKLNAGEPVETIPWEQVAANLGLPGY